MRAGTGSACNGNSWGHSSCKKAGNDPRCAAFDRRVAPQRAVFVQRVGPTGSPGRWGVVGDPVTSPAVSFRTASKRSARRRRARGARRKWSGSWVRRVYRRDPTLGVLLGEPSCDSQSLGAGFRPAPPPHSSSTKRNSKVNLSSGIPPKGPLKTRARPRSVLTGSPLSYAVRNLRRRGSPCHSVSVAPAPSRATVTMASHRSAKYLCRSNSRGTQERD